MWKIIEHTVYILFGIVGVCWMVYGGFIINSDIVFIKGLLSVLAARYFSENMVEE